VFKTRYLQRLFVVAQIGSNDLVILVILVILVMVVILINCSWFRGG
jgi:hypothetical protein